MQYTVLGVNFFNKGAELMLCAVKQEISKWDSNNIVGAPIGMASFEYRNRAKLNHVLCRSKRPELLKEKLALAAGNFIPKETRHQKNLVLESEVDAFLDASGFVFGDQWKPQKARKMLELCKSWRRQGKKVVLLPQAFGPFTKPEGREAFLELIENVDLAFARDVRSYEYISELDVSLKHIKIAPDFTNLVKPEFPAYIDALENRPCIIPNQKMIDKTSAEVSQSYVLFLEKSLQYLADKGLKPFVLLHESGDKKIGKILQEKLQIDNLIVEENNPLYLKGIISKCSFTIGSRFHGLISALSQGIPSIGTGWSHKYQMLFKDYDCSQMLISPNRDESKYLAKIDLLTNEQTRKEIAERLLNKSDRQKELSREMWAEVKNTVHC